jgi:tetratricopeptide (TPR) repeat protein
MRLNQALLCKHIVSSVFVMILSASPAVADEVSEVSALLAERQFAAALTKVGSSLKQRPHDPQLRFLKGIALTGMGSQADAIAVFTALTTDYPDLAEPHNNLAVLYASAGQYDNAVAALHKAVRANPDYGTAYENLADLYAKLASTTYEKFLEISPGNTNARIKYSLLRRVAEHNGQTPPIESPTAAEPSTLPAAIAIPPTDIRSEPNTTECDRPHRSSRTAAKSKAIPCVNDDAEKEALLSVLHRWARAWSARDVPAYLDFYGPNFRTPHQEPRRHWEERRRARIDGKTSIEVVVESPKVSINHDHAKVTFLQTYVSNNYSSRNHKTLILQRYDDAWQIVEERDGR